MTIKALSLKQPWAELIANGRMTIETRRWRTSYRGPLLIVASLKDDAEMLESATRNGDVDVASIVRGRAVCVADLYDCRTLSGTDEEREGSLVQDCRGSYGWFLRDVRRVHSVPVRGQLGLYEVEIRDEYCLGVKIE